MVEEQLNKSIMNYELLQLLSIQKSLVFLTTSVTSNQMLLERLTKTPYFKLNNEDEQEFLDDVIIDNKQAIEMATVYTDILTGTMDAYASVISNNMNVIMKRLTIVSLCLMFPTFITGFFGMNVDLPLIGGDWAWAILAVACAVVAILGFLFISATSSMSIFKANAKRIGKKKKSPSQIKYMRRKKAKLKSIDE